MTIGLNSNVNYAYKNQSTNRYYEGHDGLKVAAVPAGLLTAAGITAGISCGVINKKIKSGKPVPESVIKEFNELKKYGSITKGLLCIAMLAGANLLCGSIVDVVRNKKSKEFADKLEMTGEYDRKNTGISQNNNLYYKSNIGTKVGAALGALYGGSALLINHYTPGIKAMNSSGNNWIAKCMNIAIYTLGGAIMGRITDHFANKNADKSV